MTLSSRAYKDAIHLLNSLQSNAATIAALRLHGTVPNPTALLEMNDYLSRIGHRPHDLNALNVLHVTGTKGKGSTSAFCDSLLRSLNRHSTRPREAGQMMKVGLYTSPHLVAVRERIRIDGIPLSEDLFARYFFEVWERLESNTQVASPSTPIKPVYFRFLTLLAFHVFLRERVSATILEVGVGGAFDSTNIVPAPLSTGITSLGLDHVPLLGTTLGEVAWNKAGIYKTGVPALSVEQPDEAMKVVRGRAVELQASSLNIIPVRPELSQIKLGLPGVHQLSNASLAIALVNAALTSTPSRPVPSSLAHLDPPALEGPLEKATVEGLDGARWPGRCQLLEIGSERWHLDGAHTVESLGVCGEWFWDRAPPKGAKRVLVFNCTHGRSAHTLLEALQARAPALSQSSTGSDLTDRGTWFDEVIFCSNTTYSSGVSKGDLTSVAEGPDDELLTQHSLKDAFLALNPSFPPAKIHVLPSIEAATQALRSDQAEDASLHVLVTGSLHLVGGVMAVVGLGVH